MNNPLKRKRGRPFGSKVASGKKDGRPVFIPTEDQKFLVTMMSSTGVPEEDRSFLTGHKNRMSMATYYSAPELKKMLEYSNRVCERNDNLVLLKRKVS